VLSNAVENLLKREADLAVRMVGPVHEALVIKRIGSVTDCMRIAGISNAPASRARSAASGNSLIGFDRETPEIRSMRQRIQGLQEAVHFASRTDSDIAQLMAVRAGLGIGICQTALARRDPDLERVLPRPFQFKLGVWLAIMRIFDPRRVAVRSSTDLRSA
jgi:DNA-binding transcriptional LysR family regulator